MTRADIPAVAAIEAEVYDQPWSPRVFFDELSTPGRTYVVLHLGDAGIVGYAGMLVIDEDAHITTLSVSPEFRGRDLAKHMMLELIDRALSSGVRHLTLEVRLSNASAQGLYEMFGFEPVGRRKNYYKDEDALVMWATDIDTTEYGGMIAAIRESLREVAR